MKVLVRNVVASAQGIDGLIGSKLRFFLCKKVELHVAASSLDAQQYNDTTNL